MGCDEMRRDANEQKKSVREKRVKAGGISQV